VPTMWLVAFIVLLVLPTMVVEELYVRRLRRRASAGLPAYRHHRQLTEAADRAVAAARSSTPPGGLTLVTVTDVKWRAFHDFGLWPIPEPYAAEALRERLNRDGDCLDVLSDLDLHLDLDEPPW